MGDDDLRRLRGPAATLLAGLLLLGAAACATVVPGTAQSRTALPGTAGPAADAPSPVPGTGRLPPLAEASDDLLGGIVPESHRPAAATVPLAPLVPDHPSSCYPYGAYGVPEPLEADYFPAASIAPVLTANGFVAAWAACRAAGPESGTVLITIAMSDAEAAARTVEELRGTFDSPAQGPATPADGTPATRTFRPDGTEIVQVLQAEGPIVSSLLRVVPQGEGLTSAATILDAQRPYSAADVPTPLEQLPLDIDTRRDPVGLRTLTADPLPVEDNTNNSVTIGPYDLDGYLQFSDDPTGVGGEGEAFTVPSLPAAPCRRKPSGTGDGTYFRQCWVGYGSVLASITVVGGAPPPTSPRWTGSSPCNVTSSPAERSAHR